MPTFVGMTGGGGVASKRSPFSSPQGVEPADAGRLSRAFARERFLRL